MRRSTTSSSTPSARRIARLAGGRTAAGTRRRALGRGRFLGRVAACERKLLSEALAANHFNRRRTATALGLTYDQLRNHLKKHALGALKTDLVPRL
jgi:DNA-binding NtrC family response regulator